MQQTNLARIPPTVSGKPRWRYRALRAIAACLPRREIRQHDGSPYFERYYVAGPMDGGTAALWPSQDRPRARLTWLFRRTWYLHRLLSADLDRHLHNHPWDADGRILAGGYEEFTKGPRANYYYEGSRTAVRTNRYHKIARLLLPRCGDPHEVWTLLRCADRSNTWGFWVAGHHVDHHDYHAACKPRGHERAAAALPKART